MLFKETKLRGAYIIEWEPFVDDRGLFARTFCRREFKEIAPDVDFVQFNHSLNLLKGTLRGMHYQQAPHEEIKLVRCVRGRVLDVIVDLRQDSSTYLQHTNVELSDANGRMIYIPQGFAHGFQTLEDNTALIYHHSAYYHPGSEGGLRFDDPQLAIDWPLTPTSISEKDRSYPLISPAFAGIKR